MDMPNFSLFIQIANFLLLLWLLNLILYRPIRKMLSRRKEEMDGLRKKIEEFQERVAQYENDLRQGMIEARKEGYLEKEGLWVTGGIRRQGGLS